MTLLICAAVATAAHFLHLGRYLYQNRPWWWRLLLWYLPLTATIGFLLHHIGLVPSIKLGSTLALLPTLCLAPASFDVGQALICEVGDLLARIRPLVRLPADFGRCPPLLDRVRARIASKVNR